METHALEELKDRYASTLAACRPSSGDLAPGALDRHRPLLDLLDAVGGSSVTVFDLATTTYAYLTPSFHFLLGYDRAEALARGPEYFYGRMHPEDLPFVLDTVTRALAFLTGLGPGSSRTCKLSFDYRMEGREGAWLGLVQQVLVLEEDRRGRPWLVLIVNDLAEARAEGRGQRSLRRLAGGPDLLFAAEVVGGEATPEGPGVLTEREVEVLGLVARGLASKEIAGRLDIALATVNNHRRAILGKVGAHSSAEAVAWASRLGLV